MEKADKILRRLSQKERGTIERLVERIISGDLGGLDIKKLKGLKNLFRVRKGSIRIIFELKYGKDPNIISIERKNETTYKGY